MGGDVNNDVNNDQKIQEVHDFFAPLSQCQYANSSFFQALLLPQQGNLMHGKNCFSGTDCQDLLGVQIKIRAVPMKLESVLLN